ncbi:MAG: hypothetical protein LC808_21300 [Actinobacteria bacterium]|nr:hypothetical protein [Actinomycetota bacterium]
MVLIVRSLTPAWVSWGLLVVVVIILAVIGVFAQVNRWWVERQAGEPGANVRAGHR